MSQPRLLAIDYAKAMCIAFVVLYHLPTSAATKSLLAIFPRLPLFFFCAGLFSRVEQYDSWRSFFRQRVCRLLVPYLFFAIINYFLWLLVGRNYGLDAASDIQWYEPLSGILYATSQSLIASPPLWFLACLISLECICFAFAHWNAKKRWIAIGCVWVMGVVNACLNPIVLPWGIGAASVMLPLYELAHRHKSFFLALPSRLRSWQWFCLLLSAILICMLHAYLNPAVHISINQFGNPIYFMVGAAAVPVLWLSLSLLLERHLSPLRVLAFIGRNTLPILCLHLPVLSFEKAFALFVMGIQPEAIHRLWYGNLILWVGCLLLMLPISLFINKYMPWLVGRKKK